MIRLCVEIPVNAVNANLHNHVVEWCPVCVPQIEISADIVQQMLLVWDRIEWHLCYDSPVRQHCQCSTDSLNRFRKSAAGGFRALNNNLDISLGFRGDGREIWFRVELQIHLEPCVALHETNNLSPNSRDVSHIPQGTMSFSYACVSVLCWLKSIPTALVREAQQTHVERRLRMLQGLFGRMRSSSSGKQPSHGLTATAADTIGRVRHR